MLKYLFYFVCVMVLVLLMYVYATIPNNNTPFGHQLILAMGIVVGLGGGVVIGRASKS